MESPLVRATSLVVQQGICDTEQRWGILVLKALYTLYKHIKFISLAVLGQPLIKLFPVAAMVRILIVTFHYMNEHERQLFQTRPV